MRACSNAFNGGITSPARLVEPGYPTAPVTLDGAVADDEEAQIDGSHDFLSRAHPIDRERPQLGFELAGGERARSSSK